MTIAFSWTIEPEPIWGAIAEEQALAIEGEIITTAEGLVEQVEQYMRQNAPWQDQTGDARAGLYSDVEHDVRESVRLLMSHGPAVWYSVFLEYAHAGRFAILTHTADHFWPVFYDHVVRIVRRHSS